MLRFCEKKHLFPLLLTSKEIKDLTWRHLIDFLEINLSEIFVNNCRNGNIEIIKFLIEDSRVDPSVRDNLSIIWASINGHLEVVKLLLQDPRVDPSARNNESIIWASNYGHLEIVRLLLQDPRVDPSSRDNCSIIRASNYGHLEVVKLLLQDYRINEEIKEYYRRKHNISS